MEAIASATTERRPRTMPPHHRAWCGGRGPLNDGVTMRLTALELVQAKESAIDCLNVEQVFLELDDVWTAAGVKMAGDHDWIVKEQATHTLASGYLEALYRLSQRLEAFYVSWNVGVQTAIDAAALALSEPEMSYDGITFCNYHEAACARAAAGLRLAIRPEQAPPATLIIEHADGTLQRIDGSLSRDEIWTPLPDWTAKLVSPYDDLGPIETDFNAATTLKFCYRAHFPGLPMMLERARLESGIRRECAWAVTRFTTTDEEARPRPNVLDDRPTKISPLPNTLSQALALYQQAKEGMDTEPTTDAEAYRWLKKHLPVQLGNWTQQTFTTYLSRARSKCGENKNHPRGGRLPLSAADGNGQALRDR